jgi:hypothetical protein
MVCGIVEKEGKGFNAEGHRGTEFTEKRAENTTPAIMVREFI